MTSNNESVEQHIQKNNPWYTGSHFEWAQNTAVKRIYQKRHDYFKSIANAQVLKKGKIKLLDCGCGDGYWSFMLSKVPNCSVMGIDYNPLRLERAKAVTPDANFYEANLTQTKQTLGQFDVVLCSQVIEHIQDDISLLKALRNFMQDDGVLILGTPNEGCFTQRLRNFYTREETDHCHFYQEKDIVGKLTQTGFKVKHVFREVFYPGNDRVYYKLTSSDGGFKFLEFCTKIMPSQCSDYYFHCVRT